MQDVIETVYMPFPCLITVEQDIYVPRLPSLKIAREIGDRPVRVLSLEDFPDADPEHYGLAGSPTQVERIFRPKTTSCRNVGRVKIARSGSLRVCRNGDLCKEGGP